MNNISKIFVSITLIILMYPSVAVNAQQRWSVNMQCVEQFTVGISTWLKTNDDGYRKSAEKACSKNPNIRVADELMNYLGTRHNRSGVNGGYELETFLNILDKEDSKNHVSLTYSKPTFISPTKIDNPNIKVDHYLCEIELLIGDNTYKRVKSVFCVYGGKLVRIKKYTVSENNKVTVDYDDFINDYETIGFSYNYGQHFPIGGSFNKSFEYIPFMLSFDFGVNLDGDKYIIDKVDMTDILNYKREKKVMDPKFFLTITPQLYIKYFAVGCGVGFLYMGGTTKTDSHSSSSTSTGGGSISISTSTSSSSSVNGETGVMFKPMIRPVVKGFIPLTDELYLSLSVGYDMIFGYKDKNGFNAGLGLQWEL